ncbi:glycosyltransferase [Pseudoalteromonas distincta]|uniref:glycosyltransferase family 2 protein n=1 Tax=Pseudoalteromonas distincta TaxID=77608 RepID=UPI002342700B|nr:glycosyltransferase [Pseudoalteromonas distincta]MDC3212143.1 glycosyltransferase [Pseudoalteromonas distincta]
MKENMPLVSVWIPTCNRLELLKRAVESVKKQTYPNIEIFIVDNGSTDGTKEYLENLKRSCNNISYHCFEKNEGACKARNYAIEHTTGLYATGLDDDDEFLPERIEELVLAFDEKYAFVCSGYIWDYGKVKKSLLNTPLVINLDKQLNFNQASNQVLTYRQRLIDAGLFDISIVSSQDWELWTRMIIKYGSAKRIKKASYIVHTAHDKPRITDSLNNRLVGFEQFFLRYGHLMSKGNKKCYEFLVYYNQGNKITLPIVIKFFTFAIANKLLRAWLSSLFPQLAKIRLELFKRSGSE